MKIALRIGMVVTLAAALVLSLGRPAQAAEFITGGVISAGQVIDDDAFVSADTVQMDGTVNGVLVAMGNTVTINGTVNGDLLAFGSKVVVTETGKVSGNIFFGGQTLDLNGQASGSVFGGGAALKLGSKASVGRNLYFGGYSLETQAGSQVARSLYVGGYQAILAGDLQRDLFAGAGAVELKGKVGGNAILDLGSSSSGGEGFTNMPFFNQPGIPAAVQPGLRVADSASIGGKLTYTSSINQSKSIQAAPAGGIVYQTPVPGKENGQVSQRPIEVRSPVVGWLLTFVRTLVTLLAVGALALWLMPGLFEKMVGRARTKTLPAAGYGLIVVLVGYAAAALAFAVILSLGILLAIITLGGLASPVLGIGLGGLGLALSVFTFLVATGSKVVVAFLVGQLLVNQAAPQAGNAKAWALVVGVLIYALARSVPFVGWIVGLVATLIGLGAMWLIFSGRKTAAQEAAPAELPAS